MTLKVKSFLGTCKIYAEISSSSWSESKLKNKSPKYEKKERKTNDKIYKKYYPKADWTALDLYW